MVIRKHRVRSVAPHVRHVGSGEKVVIGISGLERFVPVLEKMGFVQPYIEGQTLLPAPMGPVSLFNAEGRDVPQKDQPMETAYREVEWHWEEWHGSYTVHQSKWVDVPYQRYPRKFTPPPAIELCIRKGSDGELLLVAPAMKVDGGKLDFLTHTANIFLEAFHECQFFSEALIPHLGSSVVRLNWDVLPPGEMPWDQMKRRLEPIIRKAPAGNQKIIYHRLEVVNGFKPDFVAVGRGGFHGYIIHGFSAKEVFVLESAYYGNATYIFGEKWEELSKMTKAEILRESLQKDRIIHRVGWDDKVKEAVNGH